jgi:hypothetical protein
VDVPAQQRVLACGEEEIEEGKAKWVGRQDGFASVVLGVIALASGLGDLLGTDLPVFPILLILIGASIILKPIIEKERDWRIATLPKVGAEPSGG